MCIGRRIDRCRLRVHTLHTALHTPTAHKKAFPILASSIAEPHWLGFELWLVDTPNRTQCMHAMEEEAEQTDSLGGWTRWRGAEEEAESSRSREYRIIADGRS